MERRLFQNHPELRQYRQVSFSTLQVQTFAKERLYKKSVTGGTIYIYEDPAFTYHPSTYIYSKTRAAVIRSKGYSEPLQLLARAI